MPPAVTLQIPDSSAWLDRVRGGSDPEAWAAFDGARVEELLLWPDEQRMRLSLVLQAMAEASTPFDALREALAGAGLRVVELRVRYADAPLGLDEYLALHFDDLICALRSDLELDAAWTGALDYRVEEGAEPGLRLLVGNLLALQALVQRKAGQHLAGLLEWGCGIRPWVELEEGDVPEGTGLAPSLPVAAPTAAPAGPAPAAALAAAPAAKPVVPQAEKLLLGRLIPANSVKPMSELSQPLGDVAIQGRIFDAKVETKKNGRVLVKLSVTDGSDSLLAAAWMPDGKAAPKELEKGATCRLRGKLEVNKYENDELVLAVDHAMLIPRVLQRRDDAPVKRVELHAHTKMSAMDAVTEVKDYVLRAAEWGHSAVGISDHGVVHALPEAAKALGKKPIKLLLGMEAYLVPDSGFIEQLRDAKDPRKARQEIQVPHFWHCMLYARDEEGRRHLYELVSHSHIKTFYKKPLIDKALLASKRAGLLVGSACENGELYQALMNGAGDAELESIASFYDYLEVQRPENNAFLVREGKATDEQLQDNVRRIVQLGLKLGKPVVATSDMHFLDPEDEAFRRILQAGQGYSDVEQQAPLYFHTTQEMLDAMAFLGPELAHKVVVEDTNKVADLCQALPPVPKGQFFPKMEGADENVRELAWARAKEAYGDPLPELVRARLERELDAVIGNKFGVLYEIARLLVKASNEKGYSVGSRGSVGSSFAAWCLHISEVNPLPSHERCPACRWVEFRLGEKTAGVDLPARPCPKCGGSLLRDGYDIPFETFVGFKGDKVPDIDLNFAPEVQTEIQKYAETLFGRGLAFKAGTVSCLAEKQAYGFAKKYFEAKAEQPRRVEIERMKAGVEGVKRTSGQHPGGVVLVPAGMDINMVTPIQRSGDMSELGGAEKAGEDDLFTTHFDYHAYDETLVKLDILGKDDGSAFRHLQDLTGVAESDVPLDDPKALSLFSSNEALGLGKLSAEEKEWLGDTGAVAIPEFGTANTRRMLELTRPKNFTELIYISGLSHGTGVWAGNAEKLIQAKTATLQSVISTRDDIMNRLIQEGMTPILAYDITEKIRKGAVSREGFSPEHAKALADHRLPTWWVESCSKIAYMFPKAHATAYCFTAMRMAWFKVHHPAAYYSAWFTLHAEAVESDVVARGKAAVLHRMRELKLLIEDRNQKSTAKDAGALNAFVLVLEALLRGIGFAKVDLYKSHPYRFMPLDAKTLLPPLVSLDGLGGTAAERIHAERALAPFRSVEELARRCGLNKTVIEKLSGTGALDILPKSDQADLFGA